VSTSRQRASESVESVAPPWGGLTYPKTHTSTKRLLLSRLVKSRRTCTHIVEVSCCALLLALRSQWFILVILQTGFSYSKEDKNDTLPVNSGLCLRTLWKYSQQSGPLLSNTVARTRTPNIIRGKIDGVDVLAPLSLNISYERTALISIKGGELACSLAVWFVLTVYKAVLCPNSSGAHPASCAMGTGGPLTKAKRGWGMTMTTHPHLVPRSRMSRSYSSYPLDRHLGV
jgi:hypothetical protein